MFCFIIWTIYGKVVLFEIMLLSQISRRISEPPKS
jgi:hypothetical protein